MPPKDPKDKKKKAKKEIILDGKNISKMTNEQLVRHAVLEAKMLVEARKQHSLQEQERDMIFRKLEMARGEMVKTEAEILSQARDMESHRYMQHTELKVGRQRAKHLRYELDQNLNKAHTETETAICEMRREHLDRLAEGIRDRDELEATNMEERMANEQDTKEIKIQSDRKHQTACENYTSALIDRTEDLRSEKDQIEEDAHLDIRNHTVMLDQKRVEQIDKLQRNFEKNYHEIKQYFQELTYHNLSLINDLAAQSHRLKHHLGELHARYCSIQKQTEASREPVRKQTLRLAALKHESDMFEKEKLAFGRLRTTYAAMKDERGKLMVEINQHEENSTKLKKEYQFMKENFAPAASEAKKIIGGEASAIREKTATLKEEVEHMKMVLREAALSSPDSRMDECLHELELIEKQCLNNIAMKKDMQLTIDKMAKLYNDTLVTMRYIVEEYGLSADQLDLNPVVNGMALRPAEIGRISATLDVLRP